MFSKYDNLNGGTKWDTRDPYSGNKKRSIGYFMRVTQFRNLFLPFKNVPSPVSPNPPGNNKISLGHIFLTILFGITSRPKTIPLN